MALAQAILEDCDIVLRNFRGEEGKYNKPGVRNFGVLLDPAQAEAMLADGWNVKQFKTRDDADEGEEGSFWLPVEAAFDKGTPPQIFMITESRGKTRLHEEEVADLDYVIIQTCDIIVNPYPWGPNARGDSGVKAYLRSMYVTIEEDPLAKKYAHLDTQ